MSAEIIALYRDLDAILLQATGPVSQRSRLRTRVRVRMRSTRPTRVSLLSAALVLAASCTCRLISAQPLWTPETFPNPLQEPARQAGGSSSPGFLSAPSGPNFHIFWSLSGVIHRAQKALPVTLMAYCPRGAFSFLTMFSKTLLLETSPTPSPHVPQAARHLATR